MDLQKKPTKAYPRIASYLFIKFSKRKKLEGGHILYTWRAFTLRINDKKIADLNNTTIIFNIKVLLEDILYYLMKRYKIDVFEVATYQLTGDGSKFYEKIKKDDRYKIVETDDQVKISLSDKKQNLKALFEFQYLKRSKL